jgi:CRP-like cAMP-binding protein
LVAPAELHLQAYCELSQQDRTLIQRLSARNVRTVGARCDVVREGEKPGAVRLLLEGWACRYSRLPDGRTQILHFFVPGDLFDANMFVLPAMDHSIASITPIAYAEISAGDFEAMKRQSPRLARAIWWNDLVNAAIAREWITSIGQRSAYERIAHLFCEMYVRLGAVGLCRDDSCDWPLTQNDLADATGLTAVHVNRTLQDLRGRGLVELRGKRLTIPDFAALAKVAMFDPAYLHLDGYRVRRAA